MTDTADREIVTTAVIPTPRARVFEAWVDPAQMVRWWGPDGFTTTMQEMDLRPGGVWQFIMHGPDGKDYKNKSIFEEIVKPERIVYARLSGPVFRMTATFDEQGGRTTVTMRMVFESAKERDQAVKVFGAVEGAKQTLARLGQHVMRPSKLNPQGDRTMRFMVMVKADKNTEAGVLPDEKLLTEMGKYNEELAKAGVLLAGEGLQPSSKGARVKFSGDKRTVIDGPFPEPKDLVAGFWIFQVKSKAEAIDWVKRCPNPTGTESEIEIRQVFEAEDFGPVLTPELREQEERLRTQVASRPGGSRA